MSDSNSNQAQKANLARIRDNQRRSRARRKEYLQELETKYRTCEAVGVEASAEIQTAARRVLEENKRLRQLLKQQGLSDAEIDGFSPASSPVNDSAQFPVPSNTLDQLLGTRRQCKPESGCGGGGGTTTSTTTTTGAADDVPRKASCASTALSQPSPSPALLPMQSQHQQHVNLGPALQPMLQPRPLSSMSAPTTSEQYSVPSGPAPAQDPEYAMYDPQAHPAYMYPVSLGDMSQWTAMPVSHAPAGPQQHVFMTTAGQPNDAYAQDPNSSSCYVAADAIRSYSVHAGAEVEEALGCGDGTECHVSNSVVFDLMDRYSAAGIERLS